MSVSAVSHYTPPIQITVKNSLIALSIAAVAIIGFGTFLSFGISASKYILVGIGSYYLWSQIQTFQLPAQLKSLTLSFAEYTLQLERRIRNHFISP